MLDSPGSRSHVSRSRGLLAIVLAILATMPPAPGRGRDAVGDRRSDRPAVASTAGWLPPVLTGAAGALAIALWVLVRHRRAGSSKRPRRARELTHDPLTGLPNRLGLEDHVARRLRQRSSSVHAMMYVDVDRFRVVNDLHGHSVGDTLLIELGEHLRARARETDSILARVGGDAFVLCTTQPTRTDVLLVAEELATALRTFEFSHAARRLGITASIGVSFLDRSPVDFQETLSLCDAACFVAKSRGRDQVYALSCFDAAAVEIRSRMDQASRIREILDQGRLRLAFQEIHPVHGGPLSCEILLRGVDLDGHELPASSIVPAAEQYGWIRCLDEWVVRNTIAALEAGVLAPFARVSVNLSGESLSNGDFRARLLRWVRRSPRAAKRIGFEVTETASIQDFTGLAHFLEQVRSAGCTVSLDDFGTGLSSFEYLKALPADFVKIDGAFVEGIARSRVDRQIVASIVSISRVLGTKVVAERGFVIESTISDDLGQDERRLLALLHCRWDFGLAIAGGMVPRPIDEILIRALNRLANTLT